MDDIVLVDHGEDAPTSIIDVDRFLEEVEARPL
jgi:hypothetical protein